MELQGFLVCISSQKHQFEQLSTHKNNVIRAKNFSWRIRTPGWNTEVKKDTLKTVGKAIAHYCPVTPLPIPGSPQKPSLWRWGKWREYQPSSRTQHQTNTSPDWLPQGAIPMVPSSGQLPRIQGPHPSITRLQAGSQGPRLPPHPSARWSLQPQPPSPSQ